MKKTAILSALLGCSIVLGACSDKEDTRKEDVDQPTEQEEQTQQNVDDQDAVDKSESVTSDDELQEAIEKEEGVTSVNLIVTEDGGGYVLLDIHADEAMSKESAGKLASTYVKTIEEKYPDHKIDIQVRKNGDTFAQDGKS